MEGVPLLHRQPAGAFLIFRRDAQRVAARRPEPTVYVEPLRRRSSCRSRWPGSLSRAAVIEFRHRSRGFRAGRDCRRNSATPLGPGPQARRTLATFLLWKVARPQAEHPPKTKQRFRRCGGEFLSERSERNQRIAGGRGFWERPAAYALVFQEPHPRTPVIYGGARGVPRQSRPARWSLDWCPKIIAAALLSSRNRCFYKMTCA